MARVREFEPQEALDRATMLFWEQGFGKTSMEELVEATGVSRYGLYGTFGGKRELFIAALRHYANMMVGRAKGLTHEDAGLADIEAFFAEVMKQATGPEARRGCMLCNTATEIAPRDPEIAAVIRLLFEQLAAAFTNALTNAQAARRVSKELDTESMGHVLVGILQGVVVFARTGCSKAQIKRYIEGAIAILS
jgi:TetR/AcrR family transcriptional repressor of nem operon